METYLVGGAVRDKLMEVPSKDLDYVIVGSNPREMKAMGFTQVGSDFPVFIHPQSKDEYALARTEKKEYTGYCGFTSAWEGVTLLKDLERRDLTINSMALSITGELIDPFNGYHDIEHKVLRHTSEAFAEDPVRVLRIARFLARFGPEWTVDVETYALCQKVAWKEFKSLTAERVFKEMQKALSEPHPELFFKFLVGLDFYWFTELYELRDIPQPIKHHPENCTFDHIMLALKQGAKQQATTDVMFAILCHDFGKAPCWHLRGNLHGHEEAGVEYVHILCDKLKVPKEYRDIAVKVCENHQRSHRAFDMQPKSIHKLFKTLGCLRDSSVLYKFNMANWADATGRLGLQDKEYLQTQYLSQCLMEVHMVDTKAISKEGLEKELTGEMIGYNIRIAQIHAIRGVKNKWLLNNYRGIS